MPSQRQEKSFRPLDSLPKPQTNLVRQRLRLRAIEAEEMREADRQLQRHLIRRDQGGHDEDEEDDAGPAEPEEWEDINHQPDHGPPDGDPMHGDPVLDGLHQSAKQIKRKKNLDNWAAEYSRMFDAFIMGRHQTDDWGNARWDHDFQPHCNCGLPGQGKLRRRGVVLVDLDCVFISNPSLFG